MQTTSHQSQGQVCSLEGGVQERYSLTMVISLLIVIDTGDALKALWKKKKIFLIRNDKILSFTQLYFFPENFNSCILLLLPK